MRRRNIRNTQVQMTYLMENNSRPRLVLRTAAAYAILLNTDKYKEVTALNTATYGKK